MHACLPWPQSLGLSCKCLHPAAHCRQSKLHHADENVKLDAGLLHELDNCQLSHTEFPLDTVNWLINELRDSWRAAASSSHGNTLLEARCSRYDGSLPLGQQVPLGNLAVQVVMALHRIGVLNAKQLRDPSNEMRGEAWELVLSSPGTGKSST